jgi:hypothetical protein
MFKLPAGRQKCNAEFLVVTQFEKSMLQQRPLNAIFGGHPAPAGPL